MNVKLIEKLLEMLLIGEADNQSSQNKQMIGEYVIVRCVNSGVHAGILQNYNGTEVKLTESRRLWRWVSGGNTLSLSGVATHGLADGSKIPPVVDKIILTDACEIMETTQAAAKSIAGYPVYEVN